MSATPTAAVEMSLETQAPQARGFFAWLRRFLFGAPAAPQAHANSASDFDTAAALHDSATATYITAPGGYRIRVPQANQVHHGINSQMIESVRDGLSLIPPLPHVVIELLKEIQNPQATAASVGAIASTDPAMAASLLRTVNSAAFALHRKITSVSDAVNYLGFASVKAMVLHLQLEQALGKGSASDPDLQDLWVHSMMVSYIADTLAKRVNGVDRGFVTTLGLLHDVGKIVVMTRFPNEAAALRSERITAAENPSDAPLSALTIERNVLGADHADLGANVAAKWGLPADLVRAIRFHHAPQKAFEATDPKPLHQAMYIVHIADQLAKYCYAYADEMEIDLVDKYALDAVGLQPDMSALLGDEAVRAAASRAIFFAYEDTKSAGKNVRRFLQLHRGVAAARLLAAMAEMDPATPRQLQIDDQATEALFAPADGQRPSTSRRFRSTGTATESGIATLTTDAKRQLAKLELPSDMQLKLTLITHCLLANVPNEPKAKIELIHAATDSQAQLAIRANGIGFASRFGPGTAPVTAARVLDSELANLLNLKWFDAITTSTDGTTLLFTIERH